MVAFGRDMGYNDFKRKKFSSRITLTRSDRTKSGMVYTEAGI